jgi:hypothetical protein
VDRVHASVDRPGTLGPPRTDGGMDREGLGRGGALTGARPPAAPVHQSSPAGAQQREERQRGGFLTGVGQHGGEDGTDTRDPCISGGSREGAENGRRESKEKAYLFHYANDARGPSGLGRPVGCGLRKWREASGAGWANGRVGRKVGRAENKEKEFLN